NRWAAARPAAHRADAARHCGQRAAAGRPSRSTTSHVALRRFRESMKVPAGAWLPARAPAGRTRHDAATDRPEPAAAARQEESLRAMRIRSGLFLPAIVPVEDKPVSLGG